MAGSPKQLASLVVPIAVRHLLVLAGGIIDSFERIFQRVDVLIVVVVGVALAADAELGF